MATWNDVKAYLRGQYKNLDEWPDGSGVKMAFTFDDGRSQVVFASEGNSTWTSISSPIGSLSRVDANRALSSGLTGYAPGGIGLVGDLVVFNCTLYTDSIQGPELVEAIRAVAMTADEIEKHLGLGDDW